MVPLLKGIRSVEGQGPCQSESPGFRTVSRRQGPGAVPPAGQPTFAGDTAYPSGRQGGRTANLQSEGGSISEPFEVSIAKESLGFSAAHFLALRGHVCERLHGHNYRIGARVAGGVDPATGFVVDFAVLKHSLRDLADRMDHRVLVPTRNPALRLREEGEQLFVDYQSPGWLVLPLAHACLLPVTHTTAELIAEYVAREVWNRLGDIDGLDVERLEIEVEESPGQGATYRIQRARSFDEG